MPQLAINGIYKNGKIIPMEDIPFHKPMNVIIVFTHHESESVDTFYYQAEWQLAEKQASEDYQKGNIRSADSIDEMFGMIAVTHPLFRKKRSFEIKKSIVDDSHPHLFHKTNQKRNIMNGYKRISQYFVASVKMMNI